MTRPAETGFGPWRGEDLVRWVPITAVAGATCVVAWFEAAGKSHVSDQIGWADAAVFGLILLFYANVVFLLRARRAIGDRRAALSTRRRALFAIAATASSAPRSADVLVAVPNGSRYHLANCLLVADRPVRAAPRDIHRASGRTECGVCQP